MRPALALAFLLVASCRPARATPQSGDRCRGGELVVDLPAPAARGPSATLDVDREGEGMAIAERATCVRIGGREVRLAAGERRRFAVHADPRRLQRLAVDGRALLARVAPGDEWMLGDHPCFFWTLGGPRTDPWFADPPHAYCAARCRQGFFHPSPPRPVEDEICGDTEVIRRCARAARVSFAGKPPPPPRAVGDDAVSVRELAGKPVDVEPRECGFFQVATATEVVGLVVGVGERWRLFIDDSGRLQGVTR